MDVFLTGCWRKPKATYLKLIVIIMCVSLVESAPPSHGSHRRRHDGKYAEFLRLEGESGLTQTNALQSPRLRQMNENSYRTKKNIIQDHHSHRMKESHNPKYNQPKDSISLKRKKSYISAKANITMRIGYVFNNFTTELKKLNIPTKENTGNPSWLPKVNFVKIHDSLPWYKNKQRQFLYIMPKIYRNLKEYRLVFDKLQHIRLKMCGLYSNEARQKLIRTTMNLIDVAMSQMVETFKEVNLNLRINHSRHSVSSIQTNDVNEGKCFAQDQIAFRGFGNAMRDWHLQLKCWPSNRRKVRYNKNTARQCRNFENRLKVKKKDKHR